MKNLSEMCSEVAAGRGASYSLTQGAPESGVMVSLYGHEKTLRVGPALLRRDGGFDKDHVKGHIIEYVAEKGVEADKENVYIGAWWKDEETLVLDLSMRYDDLEEAAMNGILHHQEAMYSIDMKTSIPLPPPQGAGTVTQKREYARMMARKLAEKYK